MATTAYGSITIVDIGDLGELSVTPQSNQPTTTIYDPDTNTYTPNWSTSGSNLKLSPVVYYGGTKLADGTMTKATGLTVTWKKQIGSGSAGAHGGSVNNTTGALTVNTNPFDPSSATLVTYIVTVQYTEANMGTTLEATGQITFGLVQNASKLKTVTITGPSAFLYNSSNVCQNSPITLTATVKNVTITKWQYKSGSSWVDISNSASSTLSVAESTSSYFSNDVGVFRVITNDANVYDEHTIIKVRDGANGTSLDSAVLSNEDQMVPCNASGTPISGAFSQCTTTLTIYEGNTPTYTGWRSSVDQNHGVTGTWDDTTHIFTASAISSETGYVVFTCTKTGHNTLTKTFSLTKVKAGADGTSPTIYTLEVDSLVVNKAENNTLTPSTIKLNAYQQVGNASKTAYSGIFKIYINGGSTAVYTSSSAESTYTYTVPSNAEKLTIELYEAGGSTLYDTQTVVVVSDGATGAQGPGGLSFVLGNYSDVIPCTNGGLVAAAQTITIPFTAYQGTTRVACTATMTYGTNNASSPPSGMTLSSNTAGTTSADGRLVYNLSANGTLGSASTMTSIITITITANGKTGSQVYTWTKNNKATDGTNAIIFQLYTPDGNVISNDTNSVVIKPQANSGTTDVTTSGSYAWYYWNGTAYASCNNVSGYTVGTRQLTVAPTAVNSYVSIKCSWTYNSKTYDAYMSIYDKTDPLQISVLSSLGDKLVNGVGTGILYTRVYRNGTEVDAIKTTNCGTSYPSSPTSGQYFWLLNTTEKTATLKKYSGSTWSDSSDQTGTYNWSRIDPVTGAALTLADNTGKAIYLDASIVDSKTIFNVEVTI